MPTNPARRQQRHPNPEAQASQLAAKIEEILRCQKETNDLLTMLVRACVRTVQVPAGQAPPEPNAVRIDSEADRQHCSAPVSQEPEGEPGSSQ